MNRHSRYVVSSVALLATLTLVGCNKEDAAATYTDASETSQQVGHFVANLDQLGGAQRRAGGMSLDRAACDDTSFEPGACTSGVKTSTFDCSLLGRTLAGSVGFTFSDNSCAFNIADTISVDPAVTITGSSGAVTATISKAGTYGIRLTRTGAKAGTASSDGIRRKLVVNGTTLFDHTTSTTADFAMSTTGNFDERDTRTVTAGTLRVTNNTTSVTCDFTVGTPLTWVPTCTCPTSGTLTKTCSDSTTGTLGFDGCGQITVGDNTPVVAEACVQL